MNKRKTKIIVSLGPACEDPEILKKLISVGVDQFRFNFSHCDYDVFRRIISDIRSISPNMPLIADLKGAEIRTVCRGGAIEAPKGARIPLDLSGDEATKRDFTLNHPDLADLIIPGKRVLIDDGTLEFVVEETDGDTAYLRSVTGGLIQNRKSAYLEGVDAHFPVLTEKDRADIAFAVEEGLDIIAASMIRSDKEIKAIRSIIPENMPLIAKIEHPDAAANIDLIADASDMILIARGDLGVQMPITSLPVIQKRIISASRKKGKPVIIATQMLESMRESPRPTRAEVTDIATSVYESVDALMLTGETAAGKYPVEAVKTLNDVVIATENDIDYTLLRDKMPVDMENVSEAISYASVEAASSLRAKAIICFTTSGTTALRVAKFRPSTPIISITTNTHVAKMLSGVFGITTYITSFFDDTDVMIEDAARILRENGISAPGDRFVITAGLPLGVRGTTNMLKVMET